MRVHCVASVENSDLVEEQIKKQTRQPDVTTITLDSNPEKGIEERRKKVVENHKKLKHAVEREESDLIWQLEGDSVVPEDCLEHLLERFDVLKAKDFGFISGAQVGRHGIKCVGAWKVGEDYFYSIDHARTGIVQIDAAGFYCYMSPRDVWLKGECEWNGERWGPDVNWGLSLTTQGYKGYVDMDLSIGHKVEHGIIYKEDPSTTNVKFYKENGEWKHKTRR